MIHWVTFHDHVGSHTHPSRKSALGTLSSEDSQTSWKCGGGIFTSRRENVRSSFASRLFSRNNKPRDTAEDDSPRHPWLRQQQLMRKGKRGGTKRPGELESGVCDGGILVDPESAPTTHAHLANPQDGGMSRSANANEDAVRHIENLRPLPLICRRTGMSPSI